MKLGIHFLYFGTNVFLTLTATLFVVPTYAGEQLSCESCRKLISTNAHYISTSVALSDIQNMSMGMMLFRTLRVVLKPHKDPCSYHSSTRVGVA